MTFRSGIFLILFAGMLSCVPKAPNEASTSTGSASWTFKGATGGFISSIAFHPTNSCEVWMSGDDMSGLYKSTDCGVNWSQIHSIQNMSTYSLAFAPNNPNLIYAVSHFGWGMLKSIDGGTSWALSQAGLPSSGTARRVYQIAISPTNSSVMVVATDDGLYRSVDSGNQFSKISLAWGTSFKAVSYDSSGKLYAGATNGLLKYSVDNGSTWGDMIAGGVEVSKLVTSTHALYVLFAEGTLMYLSLPTFSPSGIINNSATGITTGLKTSLAVKSGTTRGSDVVYLGTSRNTAVASSRWGLFRSTNGGGTWSQMGSGLVGQSIFAVGVNPQDVNNVIVGSANSSGIFKTIDGGVTWTPSSSGVRANSVIGFAQSPHNSSELVMSSTVGAGLGRSYRSLDGGASWSVINEVNANDGVASWNFDPQAANTVLAGMMSKGLYRSTSGFSGPWTRVITTDTKVDRIRRDLVTSNIVYALAREGSVGADIRVYYSGDGGASFAKRSSYYANDLSVHPTNANEAVLVSTSDGFSSTNGFQTGTSLGLTSQASEQGGLSAIAFNPNSSSEIWVGGVSGGLFRAKNYAHGTSPVWESISSPISNAIVQNILVRSDAGVKAIYVSSFGGDVYFSSNAKLGLWLSQDDGSTWKLLSSHLHPCTSFWGLYPVLGSATDLWAGLWGGGLFKMSLSQ